MYEMNPFDMYRAIGEQGLRLYLKEQKFDTLMYIVRTFTPDITGRVYTTHSKKVLVDYIVCRTKEPVRFNRYAY